MNFNKMNFNLKGYELLFNLSECGSKYRENKKEKVENLRKVVGPVQSVNRGGILEWHTLMSDTLAHS